MMPILRDRSMFSRNGSVSRSLMLSQQRFDYVPTSSWLELIRADNRPDTVGSAALNASAPQVTFLAPYAQFHDTGES